MIKNFIEISDKDISMLSSLTLAFIGDAVYELMVKSRLIERNSNIPASKLHELAVKKVKASAQSKAYDYIETFLNDKEKEVMKRGRNNNSTHYPKNANPIEYRKATGLETLFGYWYLRNEQEKIIKYFDMLFYYLDDNEF